MLPRSGKNRWKLEETNRSRREWCLVKEKNTRLNKSKNYQLNKLEKETSSRLRIWESTQKYLCCVRSSSINIKSFTIMQWSCIILHRKLRVMDQSCLANPFPNKFPVIAIILNQKLTKKREKNMKNRISKTTQELQKITKIKMQPPELDRPKCLSAVQQLIKEQILPKAGNKRNRKKLFTIEYHLKNL